MDDTRRAIHVGNLTYNEGNTVEMHIINDIMQSVKPWVATLMDNYKVLMYSGQLDIIVAAPLTENFLQSVKWSKADQYKKADRFIWKVSEQDSDIAGYVRQVDQFYQVIVRNGGHILPYDQPRASLDMITRFIKNNNF
jgi:vitellogenic carboxypeptidase-like protein